MAKDMGVELFCSEDTGKKFTFYVCITLLLRCKSFGRKGNWAVILKEGSTWAFLGCVALDSDRLVDVKVLQCGKLANQQLDFVECFLKRVIPEEFSSFLQQPV